jgi:site-specific recombinase XerD
VAEAEKLTYEKLSEDKTVKTNDIKNELIGVVKQTEMFEYAYRYYSKFETKGKYNTFLYYKSAFSKLQKYMDGKKLFIEDFNLAFVKSYVQHLREVLNNGQFTINGNIKAIKRIIREAIDDQIISFDKNPFLRFRLDAGKSTKIFLNDEEIEKIEMLEVDEIKIPAIYRDAFIFSVYVGGLRIGDISMLRWENIHNGYTTVSTLKTGGAVSIKMPNKALEIVEKYKLSTSTPKSFVFQMMFEDMDYSNGKNLSEGIKSATSRINANLKKIATACNIDKNISFHTARHTFATRALRKGMRIEYVSKLMAHSDIKITQTYAKIVNDDLDRAMDIFND